MPHKVLAIIRDDQKLQAMVDELNQILKHLGQREDFLKKQMDDFRKQASNEVQPFADRLEQYLIDTNKMPPEYDKKKHHVHLDDQLGVVVFCDGYHPRNKNPLEVLTDFFQGLT